MVEIKINSLPLPLRMGWVNCYLVKTPAGTILIDTAGANARKKLRETIMQSGGPGLVILTHGDFDHIGNAAYLRSEFGAPLAMHRDDAGMAQSGDMFINRKKPNIFIRALIPVLTGFGASERFTPDVLLEDGNDLSTYGLEARVLALPGHSRGSIGILTASGDLFCGDLFDNTEAPALNTIMDDPAAARTSLAKLEALKVEMVYPGHGQPFRFDQLLKSGN